MAEHHLVGADDETDGGCDIDLPADAQGIEALDHGLQLCRCQVRQRAVRCAGHSNEDPEASTGMTAESVLHAATAERRSLIVHHPMHHCQTETRPAHTAAASGKNVWTGHLGVRRRHRHGSTLGSVGEVLDGLIQAAPIVTGEPPKAATWA